MFNIIILFYSQLCLLFQFFYTLPIAVCSHIHSEMSKSYIYLFIY